MKALLSCLLLVFGTVAAQAQAPKIERIEIVQPGIYEAAITTRTEVPDSTIGTRSYLETLRTATAITTTIPARVGLHFGCRFRIVGEPMGRQVTLKLVTIFPPQGIRRPNASQAIHRDSYVQTARLGSEGFIGYTFDEAWEMAPGTWTFEIWDQNANRKLAEQSFVVQAP